MGGKLLRGSIRGNKAGFLTTTKVEGFVFLKVHVCACVCGCMCVCAGACVSVSVHVCLCACMCWSVQVYTHVCVGARSFYHFRLYSFEAECIPEPGVCLFWALLEASKFHSFLLSLPHMELRLLVCVKSYTVLIT